MENAALVGVMHRTRDGGTQPGKLLERFPARGTRLTLVVGQRSPVNQLHAEVMLAAVLADFIDRNDVRMIKPGGRFGFGVKTLYGGRRGQLPRENHFERDGTIEAQ